MFLDPHSTGAEGIGINGIWLKPDIFTEAEYQPFDYLDRIGDWKNKEIRSKRGDSWFWGGDGRYLEDDERERVEMIMQAIWDELQGEASTPIPELDTHAYDKLLMNDEVQEKATEWLLNKEYELIISRMAELMPLLDNSLIQARYDFNEMCKDVIEDIFIQWDLNMRLTAVVVEPRKYKKDEFEELFDDFFNNPNADPVEVKRVLGDEYWRNPSQLLHQTRREKKITVADLKKHPGFSWIDPKGTAKD
ncbi:MAG: hypothetical protein JSU77_03625 [Fidelibacterota bacterium]|nr:MAG: hypothetical protein JSU77_03625 [Candidatus Neomarinimicrobiota bacterium]